MKLSNLKYIVAIMSVFAFTNAANAINSTFSLDTGTARINWSTAASCNYKLEFRTSSYFSGSQGPVYNTWNRNYSDLIDFEWDYQYASSNAPAALSFRRHFELTSRLKNKIANFIPANGQVNFPGGIGAAGNGTRSGFVNLPEEARCDLSVSTRSGYAVQNVTPFITCSYAISDVAYAISFAVSPSFRENINGITEQGWIYVNENCN